MWAVVAVIRQLKGGLWALMGDFNMEPELLRAHPIFDELDAEIIAPEQATCITTCSWNRYDYFVVAKPLKHMVQEIRLLDSVSSYPHYPVGIRLTTCMLAVSARRTSLVHR